MFLPYLLSSDNVREKAQLSSLASRPLSPLLNVVTSSFFFAFFGTDDVDVGRELTK